ncbi:MAG: glycoside hydrolase family 32 protein [Chloroflexota bacterium]
MTDLTLNYHLMHPGGDSAPGDPNAAFYLDGTYHLHYILAHPWRGERSYSFIHLTSPDMLHWTWQTTKLQPAFTGHGMYSGTGFLTREGRPAAIYHGRGSERNQIAIACDRRLSEWEKPYPVEVRTADGGVADIVHWDPDCFLIGDTYYAVSGGKNPPVFKSRDLRHWTLIGDFIQRDLPDVAFGEDVSCPNFFELDGRWVLLCISHPLGCRYYVGDWDAEAEQFVPTHHARLSWRRDEQPIWGVRLRTDYFAPESVVAADGRRVMWAWVRSAGTDGALLEKTIQALPRELRVAPDGTLRMRPLRELEGLRYDGASLGPVTIADPVTGFSDPVPPINGPYLQRLAELDGDSWEIRLAVRRSEALRKIFGVMLFSDGCGAGLPIILRPETGTLRVGTIDAPFAVADLPDGEDLELRIFVDKYIVEVFANGRQAVLAAHMDRSASGLDAFSVGVPTSFDAVDVWRMRPTNQGYLEARSNRIWEPATE